MANPLYGQNKADDGLDLVNANSGADMVVLAKEPAVTECYNLIAEPANDTTISALESGKEYFFGTATGAPGAADSNNVYTLQLPVPESVGEKIKVTCVAAAAYGSLLGISVKDPAAMTVRYIANDNGVFIESATTEVGTDGTEDTMIKLSATHFQIGDTYEFVSLSTTIWLATINGRNGLIAAGDIIVDPGHASGYID